MNVLQVNIFDTVGGAARICWYLFQQSTRRGLSSYLAVGSKACDDTNVFEIPNERSRNAWAGFWRNKEKSLTSAHCRLLPGAARWLSYLGEPRRCWNTQRGVEDFNFPGTHRLLELPPNRVDILHAHVLHSGYFDLRILSKLSLRVPIVVTLHDEWMMTGHCACTLGCERWEIGCGECPDLSIYPPIKRDATAFNWRQKRDIYRQSRIYVATPCQWLMQRVERSMLNPAIIESRVIANGVDTTVFHQADRQKARQELGLPQDSWISLFVGHGVRGNRFKNFPMLKETLEQCDLHPKKHKHILICLGEKGDQQWVGENSIQFVDYQTEPRSVAQYYHAADVYLHASCADTFPNSVLEAQACGTPVIATVVGGIPEQIEDGVTGFLVPPGDSLSMAARIRALQTDEILRRRISARAAESISSRFSLEKMMDQYLGWYDEILEKKNDTA